MRRKNLMSQFGLAANRDALRILLRRARTNHSGMAVVEFALLMPVMLSLYFGIVEIAQGVMIDRKVTELNRALADLTSSYKGTLPDAEMSNIFDAATTIMMPFTSVSPSMVVASVVVDSTGIGRVCWSSQRNSTVLKRGDTVALPTAMKVAGTSLIMAKTSYLFTPTVGYVITGSIKIGGNDPVYMRPRNGQAGGTQNVEQVLRSNVNACPTFS